MSEWVPMAGGTRFRDTVLILLAIAVRVAAVFVLRSYDVSRSTYEHGEIVANLLAGRGFSMHFLGADGPTSQQAPVYPLVVAGAYSLGGVGTPRALLILELVQAVLGGLLVWGVLRLVRLAAPGARGVAGLAGLVVSLHPTLIYAVTHVQVATLGTTLLVWTLVFGYQAGAAGRPRDAAIAGGWLALLALTDPILSLAIIGVAWAIWQGGNGGPGRLRRWALLTVLTILTGLVGIAPWLVRNYRIHGEFVEIKSTFGYAFWQGNCALSEGTDKVRRSSVDRILDRSRTTRSLSSLNQVLWTARHEAGYLDDIALTRADYRLLGSVPEPRRSRILFHRALAELGSEPWRYATLCARRLRYFLLFDETNPKSRVWAYRLAHLGLTLFAMAGLVLARSGVRRRLMPTIGTAVAITVFHTLTIVSARFHIPIEPLMAVWGAAGLSGWAIRREASSTPAPHHVEGIRVIHGLGLVEQSRGVGTFP
jgi:hypothetical protein